MIFFDDVWPMYRDGTIERSWDPKDRSPEIALALDYVLIDHPQREEVDMASCGSVFGSDALGTSMEDEIARATGVRYAAPNFE